MTNFKDLVQLRRSHRKYKESELDAEHVRLILRSALMSPTAKGQRGWHFVVVDDKNMLEKLSEAKDSGGQLIAGAALAVVILGTPDANDCWIEDCSIAAISMQYQAEELGIGSCWVQMRGRGPCPNISADDVIRNLLNIPEQQSVLCVVAFGHKIEERKPQNEEHLKWENVHINTY